MDLPGRTAATEEPADLVLANEYLDALPVHRLRQAGSLQEAWVGWQDGWFSEILAEPSDAALAAHLVAGGHRAARGAASGGSAWRRRAG